MNNHTDLQVGFVNDDDSMEHKLRRISTQHKFKKCNHFRYSSLTPREVEIIKLLVKDLNNAQIADHLYISRHTVEQHRKNIRHKLGVNTMLQLFQFALAFDLL